jgi:hypothetical protein
MAQISFSLSSYPCPLIGLVAPRLGVNGNPLFLRLFTPRGYIRYLRMPQLGRMSIPVRSSRRFKNLRRPRQLHHFYFSNGSVRRLSMGGLPRVCQHEARVGGPLISQVAS